MNPEDKLTQKDIVKSILFGLAVGVVLWPIVILIVLYWSTIF